MTTTKPGAVMTAEERAARAADQLFEDVRGRRLLKWFFDREPESAMPIAHVSDGSPILCFGREVQKEIWQAWRDIVAEVVRTAEQAAAAREREAIAQWFDTINKGYKKLSEMAKDNHDLKIYECMAHDWQTIASQIRARDSSG